MEKRLIDAIHLSERVMMSGRAVEDPTLAAIDTIMNLRFQTLIETEPTMEADARPSASMTQMQIRTDETPHGVYCVKCNARYALNYEWIEDGAVAVPHYCPACGRVVESFVAEEQNA